jgi:DNA helicase HerA-like ATPase
MSTPISHIVSRVVGTVESVYPDKIEVLLDIDSPRSTALNTGIPTAFPRINHYVLISNESGAVVGLVVWLGVEKSPYPKRQGFKDFGLIDLPFPLRKMSVCPVGTLSKKNNQWSLDRGVQAFPSVGDTVTLPTPEQLIAIVTGSGADSRMLLGKCPSAHEAEITVDPDKLFGRHLAVLGNTGSGKSCTVAALIRSAVVSAKDNLNAETTTPNMRFIVLDPNGEYSKCFNDLEKGSRVFQVPPFSNDERKEFKLPAWMWNSSEWSAIAQAAPRYQRPLLQEALRTLRSGMELKMSIESRLKLRCTVLKNYLMKFTGKGTTEWTDTQACGQQFSLFKDDICNYLKRLNEQLRIPVEKFAASISKLIDSHKWISSDGKREGFNSFGDSELEFVKKDCDKIIEKLPNQTTLSGINEDSPFPFDVEYLPENLNNLASQEGGATSQFISTLIMRIKMLLADTRMKSVINPEQQPNLKDWLADHIGANGAENGQIAVVDLSLVPYEILHLVIAVASRLILEAQQRYRKLNEEGKNLPTVLVLEEAHTFVGKRSSQGDEIPGPADMCRQTFERIAREGRKFGLGMVLSSQRPSEISQTVLSQCNSFLLHRVTNDRDQELISHLVPDTARGLLRELPSLPTRHCIILGIAAKIPVLLEVKKLEEEQRPESEDPAFWDVWTGKEKRDINWKKIADEWQGIKDAK